MKRWVPDYANRSDTNVCPSSGQTWTATETGFISVKINRYGDGGASNLTINNKLIAEINVGGTGARSLTGVFPITVGDTVKATYNLDTPHFIYFIPGKWV